MFGYFSQRSEFAYRVGKGISSTEEVSGCRQAQKKYPDAEKVLNDLLELDPKNLQARTELAKVYQAQKEYQKAEKVLNDLLELDPKNLQARTELARVYQAQKKYLDAEKVIEESLKIDNKQLHPRTELAKVYQAQKKYLDAEKVIEESLKIDNKQLHPRTELAKVYQAQKLELDPKNLQARTELAKVYQAQKEYQKAEKVLNDLLELEPESIHAHNELARIYIKLSLLRRAKDVILTYIRTNQCQFDRVDDYLILTYLNACSKMGRYTEGVEFVDKLGCHLFSSQVAEEYGRLLRSYDLTSAVTFFEKASEKFNRSGRLLSEVAVCFKLAGRLDAKDFLEKAIRLDPYKARCNSSFSFQ
jgi:tetratricopeptide (TPR) repeat protein